MKSCDGGCSVKSAISRTFQEKFAVGTAAALLQFSSVMPRVGGCRSPTSFVFRWRFLVKNTQQGFTLIELMIVVAIIGVLAAIALPLYQIYVAKSQASRVMGEAGSLKAAVDTCLNDGRSVLGALATQCQLQATGSTLQTGAKQDGSTAVTAGTGVPQVAIDTPVTGAATIVATFAHLAASDLQQAGTNTLSWTRSTDGSWSCTSTLPEKYRPAGCL